MKKCFLLLLITALPLLSKAQLQTRPAAGKVKDSGTLWTTPVIYYLDSMEIDPARTYLDFDNIEEINVLKGNDAKVFSGGRSEGVIIITRTAKGKLITLGNLAEKFPSDNARPYQFVIDNTFVADTSNVRLDPTSIMKIDVLKNKTDKVDHGFTNSIVILVTTKKLGTLTK